MVKADVVVVRTELKRMSRAIGKSDRSSGATRDRRVRDTGKALNALPPRFRLVHIATSRFSVLRRDAVRAV